MMQIQSPFLWGSNGRAMTPEQVARERERADAMLEGVGDTSPVQHWLQGAGRVVNAITGKVQQRRADASEELGFESADDYIANDPVLAGLMGRGTTTTPSTMGPGNASGGMNRPSPTTPQASPFGGVIGGGGAPSVGYAPNEDERLILARTLQAEAGNQGYQGMVDVGSVINNRLSSGRWGDSLQDVIMAPGQFSAWNSQTGYAGGEQGQNMDFTPGEEALAAADAILSGNFEDQTGGALNYFAEIPGVSPRPSWADDSFVARGDHYFGTAGGGGGMNAQGRPNPITGGGGDVVSALSAAMSNPWVAERYGPVIEAMMGQQMRRGDMQFEAQLAQSDPMYQAQLADLTQLAQGGGAPGVRSSEILTDGTIIQSTDRGPRVYAPSGELLTGSAAAEAIEAARAARVADEQAVYGGRRTGTLKADTELGGGAAAATAAGSQLGQDTVQAGTNAWEAYGQLQTSIGNIDEALAAIDRGAESGLVYNMLPRVSEAGASLQNAMDRMGLDVIGSVTFGALSEGEMRLAMSTAVPRGLGAQELRTWLERRRQAQLAAADTLASAAQYLTTPGNTINGWIAENRARQGAQTDPAEPPQVAPSGGETTGAVTQPEQDEAVPDWMIYTDVTTWTDEQLQEAERFWGIEP